MAKKVLNVVLVLFFILLVFGGFCKFNDKKSEKKAAQVATEIRENNTKDGTLEECLKNIEGLNIIKINDNTKENGFILVTIKHTTESKRILTEECYKVLNTVRQNKNYNNIKKIDIMFMADFKDQYGNNKEAKSMSASFDKSELDKVNWNNFDWRKNTLKIASNTWFHPTIK